MGWSSWTEVGDLNTARRSMNGVSVGTTSAGLSFGGNGPPGAGSTIAEKFTRPATSTVTFTAS